MWGGKRHTGPALWLMGVERQKAETHSAHASTVLLAVFKRRSSSRPYFFMSNSIQAYKTPSLYLVYLLFIKNRMILEYQVTLLVLKLLSETYIFSAVFVINCS